MKRNILGVVLTASICIVLNACVDKEAPISGIVKPDNTSKIIDNQISAKYTPDTSTILILRGTHRERGYTHGFRKAPGIKRMFDEFIVTRLFKNYAQIHSLRADSLYEAKKVFISTQFVIDQKFRDEAGGMLNGLKAAGISLYNNDLGRDIDSMDIIMISALEEFLLLFDNKFGCSSISAWGSATSGDPYLNGETVITRAWDWDRKPEIMDNLLFVVHYPSESDEQQWCGVLVAGMIGCHSVMNEKMGAFLNYGYRDTIINPGTYKIISHTVRKSIESRDLDGNGSQNTADVVAAFKESTPYFSAIVHVVAEKSTNDSALVIEISNNKGIKTRVSSTDPNVEGPTLIATNHMRVEYVPEDCYRYENLKNGLNSAYPDTALSVNKIWDLHTKAAGVAWNQYFLMFVPAKDLVWFSKGTEPIPGYQIKPVCLTINGDIQSSSVSVERRSKTLFNIK